MRTAPKVRSWVMGAALSDVTKETPYSCQLRGLGVRRQCTLSRNSLRPCCKHSARCNSPSICLCLRYPFQNLSQDHLEKRPRQSATPASKQKAWDNLEASPGDCEVWVSKHRNKNYHAVPEIRTSMGDARADGTAAASLSQQNSEWAENQLVFWRGVR